MEWIEVFVATSQMGLEPVEGVLYQCGLNGLMIHDEADFAEFLENPNREWDYVADELVEEKQEQTTGITFFLRDNLYGREQLSQIKSALQSVKETEKELDLGSLEVTMKNVAEEDWANNWKKYFKPFPVGDKIMIKPSWEELPAQTDKIILKIDPGHIFGTGTHETTQLCMELIEKYVKKDDMVLDIGCGSACASNCLSAPCGRMTRCSTSAAAAVSCPSLLCCWMQKKPTLWILTPMLSRSLMKTATETTSTGTVTM